jgi:hypothetical protein
MHSLRPLRPRGEPISSCAIVTAPVGGLDDSYPFWSQTGRILGEVVAGCAQF